MEKKTKSYGMEGEIALKPLPDHLTVTRTKLQVSLISEFIQPSPFSARGPSALPMSTLDLSIPLKLHFFVPLHSPKRLFL